MFKFAEDLSVPQSQTYNPLSLFSTFLRLRILRLPSTFMVIILEALISISLWNHFTGTSLLSSQSNVTSSFSTAVKSCNLTVKYASPSVKTGCCVNNIQKLKYNEYHLHKRFCCGAKMRQWGGELIK